MSSGPPGTRVGSGVEELMRAITSEGMLARPPLLGLPPWLREIAHQVVPARTTSTASRAARGTQPGTRRAGVLFTSSMASTAMAWLSPDWAC